MQVGCGVYVHEVRGRPYLYFWHYEGGHGSRGQVTEYVGPAGTSRAREEARRRCESYYARAAEWLDRMQAATLAALASL